jgi:hypothetical protein
MTDKTTDKDRLTMPGQGPTDEDLRQDAELTRQELAQTMAALGDKVDVKARAHDKADELRERAHEKAEELRERGDELVNKLPDPVATRVRPVVTGATRKPMVPLASLVAFILVLRFWLKRRNR